MTRKLEREKTSVLHATTWVDWSTGNLVLVP